VTSFLACDIIDTCQFNTSFKPKTPRLEPIACKVLAGERLTGDDAFVLYGTADILAVGWLANHVRERLHGDKTYFNVNRHINPTNVCVAACRLCAFGAKEGFAGRLYDGAGRGLRDGCFRIQRGGN